MLPLSYPLSVFISTYGQINCIASHENKADLYHHKRLGAYISPTLSLVCVHDCLESADPLDPRVGLMYVIKTL